MIGTDRSDKTVHTQIRLLLKEQSDQGLHCLLFSLHLLDALLHHETRFFNVLRQSLIFKVFYTLAIGLFSIMMAMAVQQYSSTFICTLMTLGDVL